MESFNQLLYTHGTLLNKEAISKAFFKGKKEKFWSFSLCFLDVANKGPAFSISAQLHFILEVTEPLEQSVACKFAEQEPDHKQKHAGASIREAQEQNINHLSCLGKNSFCLVMAHNKVSCLSFLACLVLQTPWEPYFIQTSAS